MEDNVKRSDIFIAIFFIIIVILALMGAGTLIKNCENRSRPVERNAKVDSLINNNKLIKIEVRKLDSIKDEKINEVKHLDNDNTLKLFKELVSE